jgi:hypothetical protein
MELFSLERKKVVLMLLHTQKHFGASEIKFVDAENITQLLDKNLP